MSPRKPTKLTASLVPIVESSKASLPSLIVSQADLLETFYRGKDPKTIRVYNRCMEDFTEWLESFLRKKELPVPGPWNQKEAARVFLSGGQGQANLLGMEFRSALKEAKYAPSSINTHLVALRSMVKVARLIGLVPWVLDVDKVANEIYRDTLGPGTDRFSEVMNELEKRTDKVAIRDRALLSILHDAGLRRDEAHSLDLEHVDFENHRVWVEAKMRSSREGVAINSEVERCLKDWLKIRGSAPGALFKNFDLDKKGDRLSGNGISRISHKYGLGHPHGLRHLAVTEALLVSGGNIPEVMKFSRHKDPKTVMIYDDRRKNVSGEISEKIAKLRKKDPEKKS